MTETEQIVAGLKDAYEKQESRQRLVYIPIEDLLPHPDNPRQDLGDLTELTDSIIANGVMQNLTVVPCIKDTATYDRMLDGKDEGSIKYSAAYRAHAITHAFENKYTVIIGHRRHAAATLAGVKELPCVVVDMDYPTQIATMMTENLQRVDLTVYEQAQGFKQLSMNFGMSIDKIAEKTGFSASTVRRRLKLSELNQDTLKKVSGRQINMSDFERLDKIDDPKLRNEALAEIGTANFNNKCTAAEQEIEKRKRKEELRKICLAAGVPEVTEKAGDDRKKYNYVHAFYGQTPTQEEVEKYLEEDKNLCFYVNRWNYVYLVTPKTAEGEDEKNNAQAKKEEARQAACAALDEAFERAYKLRRDFIKGFTEAKAKAKFSEIVAMMTFANMQGYGGEFDEDAAELLGADVEQWNETDTYEECFMLIEGIIINNPYLTTLVTAYTMFGDSALSCRNYNARYGKNEKLTDIYDRLCSIGYEMSDEEKALMDGTSELYIKEEKSND